MTVRASRAAHVKSDAETPLRLAEQLRGKRPRHGAVLTHRLLVEERDCGARAREGSLDAVGEIVHQRLIHGELAVGGELDDQRAQQRVVGGGERDARQRAQARGEIEDRHRKSRKRRPRSDKDKSALLAREIDQMKERALVYTSDAADEEDSVDLGGRRIIK